MALPAASLERPDLPAEVDKSEPLPSKGVRGHDVEPEAVGFTALYRL